MYTLFQGNEARSGGAFTTVDSCSLYNNIAELGGGQVWITSGRWSTMTNAYFHENLFDCNEVSSALDLASFVADQQHYHCCPLTVTVFDCGVCEPLIIKHYVARAQSASRRL